MGDYQTPQSAAEIMAICRAWLDAEDPTHWGRFEQRLNAAISDDMEQAEWDAAMGRDEPSPEDDLAAAERAIDRMGWDEIHAFQDRLGQSPYEDAGGFMLRKIKRLFGICPDPLPTYQEAARAMLAEARKNIR